MKEVLEALEILTNKIDRLSLRIELLEKKLDAGFKIVPVETEVIRSAIVGAGNVALKVDKLRRSLLEKYKTEGNK